MNFQRTAERAELVDVGVSRADTPYRAVMEAASAIDREATGIVLAFLPETLDPVACSEALSRAFGAIPVHGCTSAGQITPNGYENDALLLIGLPKRHFRCAAHCFSPLHPVSIEAVASEAARLESMFGPRHGWQRVGVLFADGLSKQEDVLVAAVEAGLKETPVFGGSAGHGLVFDRTFVLCDGRVHTDAALFLILETDLGVEALGFHHFLPTETQMVVTAANPEERLVMELNGAPAAEEYARLVGCKVSELSPQVFARNPALVYTGRAYHVRAIQRAQPDGALEFLGAIDDGLILTLGRGQEILRTMEKGLALATRDRADFVLGFDCVLRRLEIELNQMMGEASAILRRNRVIGFNTYGEQHDGVHVNQTFVGLAFFRRGDIAQC